MRKYRTRPLKASGLRSDGYGDFIWIDEHPPMERSLTVYDQEPAWKPLGVLGPDGEPIEYLDAMDPVGFLWSFHEDEE